MFLCYNSSSQVCAEIDNMALCVYLQDGGFWLPINCHETPHDPTLAAPFSNLQTALAQSSPSCSYRVSVSKRRQKQRSGDWRSREITRDLSHTPGERSVQAKASVEKNNNFRDNVLEFRNIVTRSFERNNQHHRGLVYA